MKLYHCKHCDERIASAAPAYSCRACGRRLAPIWMPEIPRAAPGTYLEDGETYASMEDFVSADPRRADSREIDFGLYWRNPGSSVTHRAAWIEATGELYMVQSGAPSAGGGHVEVLAVADRRAIEVALRGWATRCLEPGSLNWLRQRASANSQDGLRLLSRPARMVAA